MWLKRGLICAPRMTDWWNQSHCYCPTPMIMEDRIRVFYASWDKDNRGRITYCDLDKFDPSIILYHHDRYVLDIGEPGFFDCDGVGPSYIMKFDEYIRMYYFGFQRTSNPNATLVFCGIANSIDDGNTFVKYSDVPILDRVAHEIGLRSSVSVLDDDGRFKVWYTGDVGGWSYTDGKLFSKSKYPKYSIRYIESENGILFKGNGLISLSLEGDEFALGRPWVIKEGDVYKMWYSKRGVSSLYKIGYAESKDGKVWKRLDNYEETQFYGENEFWDSEMQCFPAIVKINDEKYMFYNGNNHGKYGFGLSTWE